MQRHLNTTFKWLQTLYKDQQQKQRNSVPLLMLTFHFIDIGHLTLFIDIQLYSPKDLYYLSETHKIHQGNKVKVEEARKCNSEAMRLMQITYQVIFAGHGKVSGTFASKFSNSQCFF